MKFITSFLLIFTTILLNGQPEYFTPYPMEPALAVEADTMGRHDEGLIDSTGHLQLYRKNLEVWLVENNEEKQRAWRMNESGNILNLRYHDFNGGDPELILTWQSLSGHSGWQGGVAEQSEEMVIYDTENSMVLLHVDTYTFVETWWQELDKVTMDSLGSDTIIVLESGGDHYCTESRIEIRDSSISIIPVPTERCESVEPEDEFERISLVWRNSAFFRRD